jgi:hypothetical protein
MASMGERVDRSMFGKEPDAISGRKSTRSGREK